MDNKEASLTAGFQKRRRSAKATQNQVRHGGQTLMFGGANGGRVPEQHVTPAKELESSARPPNTEQQLREASSLASEHRS